MNTIKQKRLELAKWRLTASAKQYERIKSTRIKIQTALDEELARTGRKGTVRAVIERTKHGLIYTSLQINDDIIANTCNLGGDDVLSYRRLDQLKTAARPGVFVCGERFGLKNDRQRRQPWVKLIDIEIDPDAEPNSPRDPLNTDPPKPQRRRR